MLQSSHPFHVYVTRRVLSPTATIAMEGVKKVLGLVVRNLNDGNYARSLASCRS